MGTYDIIEDTETSLAAPSGDIGQWTVDDIRKSDILVFRESTTDYVDNVIAPNGLQVGLLDKDFLTNLLVTGHITGSGYIYSELGFSGSLQTLTDGSDYLRAGAGITIDNNQDGSITITSTGGGGGAGSRIKKILTGLSADNTPITVDNLPFANYSYSTQQIDVFLNGELQVQGDAAAVGSNAADFFLGTDVDGSGQINFGVNITPSDELVVIVGSGSGGGGGGGGITYGAGSGITLSNDIFSADVDGTTVGINQNSDISVIKTPGTLSAGQGLNTASFDGSGNVSLSVKAVSGSPVVISGAGVDFSLSPLVGAALESEDEILVSKDGTLHKSTVGAIIAAAGGSPGVTNAAYLVAQSSEDLSNERVLQGGPGISVTDDAMGGNFTISAVVETSGGLKLVNGKLAVQIADFIGAGLNDNNGVIEVNPSDFAGTSLVVVDGKLEINFGNLDGEVAEGSNTITVDAGDGLRLGGTATIGDDSSTINLEVQSTDISGLGLSVSNNNLDVYLDGINGINILSGSSGELIIDAGAAIEEATSVNNIIGGPGITSVFDASSKEYTISLDYLDQNNVFESATDGTNLTLDETNDRILVFDADTQEVIQISPSQIAGQGGGKPVAATKGITSTDNPEQFDLEIDYDDTDNVVTSAHDPVEDWEIDESNDKILVYDNDQEQVIKISPSQFSGGAGKIGDAEDGTYDDGLFTDFNPDTPTGTAIDRFNEILKALAPAPAPDLFEINENVSDGVAALLSFGVSNQTAYENVVDLDGTLGKDVNDAYGDYTDGNNLVRGVYTSKPTINGHLNDTVVEGLTQPTELTNYSSNAFGSADIGSLVLEINGLDIQSIDLTDPSIGADDPPAGSGSYLVDGSGFTNVSIAKAGQFDSGASFDTFKHRTARFRVDPFHQREGWNYVKVKHVRSQTNTIVTNHIQWVVDNNAEQPIVTGEAATFTGTGSFFLSGVEYFTGGSVNYQASIENYYKFVYALNNITFTTNGTGLISGLNYTQTPEQVDQIDVGNGETHEKVIVIDKTSQITSNYILGGSLSTSLNLVHPTKNNLSNDGTTTISEVLMYSATPASSITSETFVDENYRVPSGAYDTQNEIMSAQWDSESHMLAGDYSDGLQFFKSELKSPLDTINSGNFSSFQNGPDGNPDYSNASGNRTLYRKFQNTEGDVHDFSWSVTGNTDLDPESSQLQTDNIHVLFKFPSNGVDDTGWMDACSQFVYNSTSDGDGGYIGNFDNTSAATNYFTIGTGSIGDNDWIVAKIVADSSWTGDLNTFDVSFGATGVVNPSGDLETLNINESADSTDAKLSWGDTLNLTDYFTVENDGGNAPLNANDECVATSNRLGTIGPVLKTITGTLNFGKAGNGQNYPSNAFGGTAGNLGTLRIIVNDAEIHSEDLSTFGSGNSVSNGTGFNLSAATVGRDSNGLPNYEYFYRTGTYSVSTTHQREGWNWARVEHEIDGTIHDTNYVEWINDSSNPSLTSSGEAIDTIVDTDISYLSGVQYFESPSGKFRFTMANAYKYVYSSSTSAVRINVSTGVNVSSISVSNGQNTTTGGSSARMPELDPTQVSAYDADVIVEADWNYAAGNSVPGATVRTITLRGQVDHPLVGPEQSSSVSKTNWLVKTINDTSSSVNENFSGENYRLKDAAYPDQASVSNSWDSTISLESADPEHNTGLIVYNGQLRYPSNAGLPSDLGDFRDESEGGSLNAPIGNPDYSGASGERVWYRKFQNNTGASQSNLTVSIQGSGTTIGTGASPTGNEVKVFIKMPVNTANPPSETGYLDIGKPFATNQYADDDGALLGDLDSTIPSNVKCTLGVNSVRDDEWIIIKIVANDSWTGYVSNVSVSWG